MKTSLTRMVAIGAVICATAFGALEVGRAQAPGFARKELQRGDLSVPGREVVTVLVEFAPGGSVGRHTHFGEEVSYVLEGNAVLEVDGQPPRELNAGDVFFVPAGIVHAARNSGGAPSKVLVNYVVEKGKPLATAAK